jgi:hypothetical protein
MVTGIMADIGIPVYGDKEGSLVFLFSILQFINRMLFIIFKEGAGNTGWPNSRLTTF